VVWVSFGTSFTVVGDGEIDVPINPATPIGLYTILVLIENSESTNSQTFSVTGDQTPSGISVSPSPWVAGSQIEIQITGLNFGTNQPQVSFSCCLDNNFSPDSWSDTLITGMVDVDPGAAGQTVTVTVGSTGYGGFSFVPGPGQTNQASTTVNVIPPDVFNVFYGAYIPVDNVPGPTLCFNPSRYPALVPLIYMGDAGRGTYRASESILAIPDVHGQTGFTQATGQTRNYGAGSPGQRGDALAVRRGRDRV
jgi:hypothetical protein